MQCYSVLTQAVCSQPAHSLCAWLLYVTTLEMYAPGSGALKLDLLSSKRGQPREMETSAGAAGGPSGSLGGSPVECHGLSLKILEQLGITYGVIVVIESCSSA